jgi:hypothetical protein
LKNYAWPGTCLAIYRNWDVYGEQASIYQLILMISKGQVFVEQNLGGRLPPCHTEEETSSVGAMTAKWEI